MEISSRLGKIDCLTQGKDFITSLCHLRSVLATLLEQVRGEKEDGKRMGEWDEDTSESHSHRYLSPVLLDIHLFLSLSPPHHSIPTLSPISLPTLSERAGRGKGPLALPLFALPKWPPVVHSTCCQCCKGLSSLT